MDPPEHVLAEAFAESTTEIASIRAEVLSGSGFTDKGLPYWNEKFNRVNGLCASQPQGERVPCVHDNVDIFQATGRLPSGPAMEG